jgi:hypothetical protein
LLPVVAMGTGESMVEFGKNGFLPWLAFTGIRNTD